MAKKKEVKLTNQQQFFFKHLKKITDKFRSDSPDAQSGEMNELADELRKRIEEVYESNEAKSMMARILSPLAGTEIVISVPQKIKYLKNCVFVLVSDPADSGYAVGKPLLAVQEGEEVKRAMDANGRKGNTLPEEGVPGKVVRPATDEELQAFVIDMKDKVLDGPLAELKNAWEFVQEEMADQ